MVFRSVVMVVLILDLYLKEPDSADGRPAHGCRLVVGFFDYKRYAVSTGPFLHSRMPSVAGLEWF